MSDANYLTNKSLGQHWLFDAEMLESVANLAEVVNGDNVLEVGPGLGTLTERLIRRGAKVTAVEIDKVLAGSLKDNIKKRGFIDFQNSKNSAYSSFNPESLIVKNEDILKFNLQNMPQGYKVCANIPYYLTSHLIRHLLESDNAPSVLALLIQKEVAERIAAVPGSMSILSVTTQYYAKVSLGELVPAKFFTPAPKVDSQIIQIKPRSHSLFKDVDESKFFQIVKAGFSEKRKKLRSSLSGGLRIPKGEVDDLLARAGVSPDDRAQELSLDNWYSVYRAMNGSL